MSFISVSFLLFLALLIFFYYVLPKGWQWQILLAGSYIFYLFAGVKYLAFILFTTITTYLVTVYMDGNNEKCEAYISRHKKEMSREEKKVFKKGFKIKNRVWFIVVIAANFGILFFCKACLIEPFTTLCEGQPALSFLTLGLPMGMSFYMFQSMGYVIDVYRGKEKALKNPFKVALFTAFFPQLVQGPISKFSQLKDQLFTPHAFDSRAVSMALMRMLWGFFKKLVVADRVAAAIGTLKGTEYTGVSFFIMTLFYSVQLYADFSGGIDIAIGAGEALGIKLPENFIRPFFSKNIAEYWRRWHITLNEWMKSYIFYPITVAGPMLKLGLKARKKIGRVGMRLPIYIGALLCWLGTGVWHGFNLHFIVWGLINGFVIVISEELAPVYEKFHSRFKIKQAHPLGYKIFEIARTFLMMNLIRALDLFEDVGEYFARLFSLCYDFNFNVLWDGTLLNLGLSGLDYIIAGCGVILMFIVSVMQRKGSVRERLLRLPAAARYAVLMAGVFAVLLIGCYGVGYDASSFIYNQF